MPDTTPDWFQETPDDTSYDLTMYDSGGGSIQNVELSRDEYVDLKEYLAAHRGQREDAQPRVLLPQWLATKQVIRPEVKCC